jgi:hypothetical protein
LLLFTKSKFIFAVNCPRKLAYLGNSSFHDISENDPFLKSLTASGFQVGALAKQLHLGGVDLECYLSQSALVKTKELLQSDAVTIFQQRYVQLASQKQPRKAKPSKPAPQKAPQQQKRLPSSTDTPKPQKDAEGRSKGQSRIMQGVQQAEPTLADQQRALRGKVYGAQNNDVAFRKAAQVLAR